MKTKYKKIKNKIFVGLGATATIVAPVVSTVSFGVSPDEESKMEDFISNWKNSGDNSMPSPELINEVLKSSFYSNQLRPLDYDQNTKCWKIQSNAEWDAALDNLARTNFTTSEKYKIANAMLSNQPYSDFIDFMGFDANKGVEYSDIEVPWGKNESLISGENINNSPKIGKTGFQKDYHFGKINNGNDRVYDISTNDVLKYFVSISFISDEFDRLFSIMYYFDNKPIGIENLYEPNYSSSLIDTIKNWNSAVEAFWTTMTPKQTNASWIKSLPDFKYIEKIDDGAVIEEQAYKNILKSNLVKKDYDPISINDMANTIDDKSSDERIKLYKELASKISDNLKSFRQKAVNYLKSVASESSLFSKIKKLTNDIDKPNSLISRTAFESVLSFAKVIMDYSNLIQKDVEVRIKNNPFVEYGIRIRGGHEKFSNWDPVENLGINSLFIDYDDGANMIKRYKPIESFKTLTHLEKEFRSDFKAYPILAISAERKSIMVSSYAIRFAMKIQVGNNYFKPKLVVYENDHDADDDLKNVIDSRYEGALQDFVSIGGPVIAVTLSPVVGAAITLAGVIPGLINSDGKIVIWRPGPSNLDTYDLTEYDHEPSVYLDFWRNEKNDNEHEDEYTKFPQMTIELKNLFTREWNEWKTKAMNNHTWDPSSVYEPKLSIYSFEFPRVYFNTYDDPDWDHTHSDFFRFNDAKINYKFIVTEKID